MARNERKMVWSPELAYAVGLITTDGCLINDGRHIDITSKDVEQLKNAKECLSLSCAIGYKKSGYGKRCARIQFGDVMLYRFLEKIGLTPAKTKILGSLDIPKKYFFDFLRGHYDGDGSFYSYWDKRWRSSFMFYLSFVSASRKHIDWIRSVLGEELGVGGHLSLSKGSDLVQLKYAKKESLKVLKKMYYSEGVVCLRRKRLKVEKALSIIGESL